MAACRKRASWVHEPLPLSIYTNKALQQNDWKNNQQFFFKLMLLKSPEKFPLDPCLISWDWIFRGCIYDIRYDQKKKIRNTLTVFFSEEKYTRHANVSHSFSSYRLDNIHHFIFGHAIRFARYILYHAHRIN